MQDQANTPAVRAQDRARLTELYAKLTKPAKTLGDIVLEAYDRGSAMQARQLAERLEADPNAQASAPLEFTLGAVQGESLRMAALRGKVVVLDFWATWCGPCRAQKPLYDEVKARFKDDPRVVFLAVNTDEERSAVEPFLEEQGWSKQVYYDDGLARHLRISSIPTTIILDRNGDVASRLNGFLPERFVDMLTERIREALAE
jgi:thiol-disulfide isomerase/thioredoxin